MNGKQAYAAGKRAFLAAPCGPDRMECWCRAYKAAEEAGLREDRDTVSHKYFRAGYNGAHADYYQQKLEG